MFLSKFLPIVVIVTLWLSESYGDGDVIPSPVSKCDPPCQQYSPPLSGYPSYGAPPPPSGYSIYGAPPPPAPPHEKGQSKCPPASGVQCCTPPAPYILGYGPPNPTYYAPPNPYTYTPYGEAAASASMFLPILVPLMVLLLFSFMFGF